MIMSLFWILVAAMLLVTVGVIALVLLRTPHIKEIDARALNVDIARERLQELEKEYNKGELSDEEFQQARADLELALAQDLSNPTPAPLARKMTGRIAALVVSVVLIPTITLSMYLQIGSPHALEVQGPGASQTAATHSEGQMPPIEDLVQRMEEKLAASPQDPQGWYLLGRTYMKLERYADAARAYEQLNKIVPEGPASLLPLADALAMTNDGNLEGRPLQLITRVLELEPDNITALWLAGQAAVERGDNATALEHWQRAHPLMGEDPQMQQQLAQMIVQIGGRAPAPTAELPSIMAPPAVATAAPGATNAPAVAEGGASLVVQVALASELIEQANPQDTVFVFAKAVQGPPMPLAVARATVADLPLEVTLTDSMAMTPAMKLSSFAQVKVSARISKSGQAIGAAGDMESDETITPNSSQTPIQLLINKTR